MFSQASVSHSVHNSLLATRSLLMLVTAWPVRILLECFLVSSMFVVFFLCFFSLSVTVNGPLKGIVIF